MWESVEHTEARRRGQVRSPVKNVIELQRRCTLGAHSKWARLINRGSHIDPVIYGSPKDIASTFVHGQLFKECADAASELF